LLLGVPAFIALVIVMVAKPILKAGHVGERAYGKQAP
jgi:hypothetical protein